MQSLLRQHRTVDGLIVIKLDVEGLEAHLLAMLDSSTDEDVLAVYEDHGRDEAHSTTRAALDAGFRVAFVDWDGSLTAIDPDSLQQQLDELKSNPRWGYNFVAVAPSGLAAGRLREAFPELTVD